MHTFIDEAGDFAIPISSSDHRVAVSAAVTFTDSSWRAFDDLFLAFKSRLSTAECHNGEPKWHLLSTAHRDEFIALFHDHEGVSITPVTLDLSHLAAVNWLSPMLDKLRVQADSMRFLIAREQISLLHRQASKLSKVQHLRLYSWAYCVHLSFLHAIMLLGHDPADAASWNTISIEIDAVQRQPRSRESLVFETMVLAWLSGWSSVEPFVMVEGLHTDSHPFVQKYFSDGSIDLGLLLRGNISWGISKNNRGLQIADLVASVVYAAADAPLDTAAVSQFALLMRNGSHYGAARGCGLFSPVSPASTDVSKKYASLSAAMR